MMPDTDEEARRERLREKNRSLRETMAELRAEKPWHLHPDAPFLWSRVPVGDDHHATPMRGGFFGNQIAQRCLCCGDAAVFCAVFPDRPFSEVAYYAWTCGCGTVRRVEDEHVPLLMRLVRLVDGDVLRSEDRATFGRDIAEAAENFRRVAAARAAGDDQ